MSECDTKCTDDASVAVFDNKLLLFVYLEANADDAIIDEGDLSELVELADDCGVLWVLAGL